MAEPGDESAGAARRRHEARARDGGTRCTATTAVVAVGRQQHHRNPARQPAREAHPPGRTRVRGGCPPKQAPRNPDPPRSPRSRLVVGAGGLARHRGDRAVPPRSAGGVAERAGSSHAAQLESSSVRSRPDRDSRTGRARTARGSADRCRPGSSLDSPSPGGSADGGMRGDPERWENPGGGRVVPSTAVLVCSRASESLPPGPSPQRWSARAYQCRARGSSEPHERAPARACPVENSENADDQVASDATVSAVRVPRLSHEALLLLLRLPGGAVRKAQFLAAVYSGTSGDGLQASSWCCARGSSSVAQGGSRTRKSPSPWA